ncbi:DUF202 domain-containing protein [Streptomyces sp. NPDC050617]|uniref:DUF202 domain-containing protein n=1 Tax=Streptomyces sp. NPDC050617 TaxID=3154628 RepID=UPI0034400A0F
MAAAGAPEGYERRDPGLQPERTRMAWRRTTLSCAVAGVLAVRQALRSGPDPLAVLAVALIALVFLAFLGAANRRMHTLNAPRPPALSPRAAVAAAVCVIALAALGAGLLR